MRLTSIEFSFDPCNIYRDGPRGVGYPADARSVSDSHPSCDCWITFLQTQIFLYKNSSKKSAENLRRFITLYHRTALMSFGLSLFDQLRVELTR